MTVQLLRNTRLWVSTVTSGHSTTNTWEIQVQDDLSFGQSSTSTDIEVSEAGPAPTRGSARFNDSLDPAEWSFSTYIRPYEVDPNAIPDDGDEYKITPDALLWHALSSGSAYDTTNANGVQANDTNMLVKFTDSQHHELLKINIYMLVDNIWYVITGVQVNEATISNDIDGIGMVSWSGQGLLLDELSSQPFDPSTVTSVDCSLSAEYIRNKLTILKVKDNTAVKTYDIPITGGSVTFSNNITYLTPSTLACLDIPIGSFTGSLSISGEMSAYLDDRAGGTTELIDDMLTAKAVTNSFEIAVVMGGSYATPAPAAVIVLPTAQLDFPNIESADVIGTTIAFKAIGSTLSAGDEAFVGIADTYTTTEIDRLISTGDGKA